MFNISFRCCRHNVSNIFVQLTEGRSARGSTQAAASKKKLLDNVEEYYTVDENI